MKRSCSEAQNPVTDGGGSRWLAMYITLKYNFATGTWTNNLPSTKGGSFNIWEKIWEGFTIASWAVHPEDRWTGEGTSNNMFFATGSIKAIEMHCWWCCPKCLHPLVSEEKGRMEPDMMDHPVRGVFTNKRWKSPLLLLKFCSCLQTPVRSGPVCRAVWTAPAPLHCIPVQYCPEDGDTEENPPREGRCVVHNAVTRVVLSAALCPPGKDRTNHKTG